MGDWCVIKEGGIGRTRAVIGPFDSMDDAWEWFDEQGLSAKDNSVKPMREP